MNNVMLAILFVDADTVTVLVETLDTGESVKLSGMEVLRFMDFVDVEAFCEGVEAVAL
jgi:hypothetical protein